MSLLVVVCWRTRRHLSRQLDQACDLPPPLQPHTYPSTPPPLTPSSYSPPPYLLLVSEADPARGFVSHHLGQVGPSSRAVELCESRGGRPGLSVSEKPAGFCGRKATLNFSSTVTTELRNCVKVEVAVLRSPSLINLLVSVDVKQH